MRKFISFQRMVTFLCTKIMSLKSVAIVNYNKSFSFNLLLIEGSIRRLALFISISSYASESVSFSLHTRHEKKERRLFSFSSQVFNTLIIQFLLLS